MFIPQGKPVYENLATRYLLVDALIDDLREKSFAGVLQAILPDGEYRVLLDDGKIFAVVEKQKDDSYAKAQLSTIVARCREERGNVSIYSYPGGLAAVIAGRLNARPLYVNLSSEFADLEKLIAKLMRETDRKWFVEVTTDGEKALVHIAGGTGTFIQSDGEMIEVAGQTAADLQSSALRDLIASCHTKGGMFDVLFLQPGDEDSYKAEPPEKVEGGEPKADLKDADSGRKEGEGDQVQEPPPVEPLPKFAPPDEAMEQPANFFQEEIIQPALPEVSDAESSSFAILSDNAVDQPDSLSTPAYAITTESAIAFQEPEPEAPVMPTRDLMASIGNNREVLEALKMAEVNRLMGKVVKTVEDAVQAADQRDQFNLHLRSGQIKVADRFPFLDPFGSEFEYLDGEIAFIGHCKPDDFVRGLTEALKIAITETARASARPVQVRTSVTESLKRLVEANNQEFELYKLDEPINEIIGRQ